MPYEVDLTAEGFADDFRQLKPWDKVSLEQALAAASLDPHLLPDLRQVSPNARVLEFAEGRGHCLVHLDDEAKTMTVRIMQVPR